MLRSLFEGFVQLFLHELAPDSTRTRVREVILHHYPRIATPLLCSDFVDAFEYTFEDCSIGIVPESTAKLRTRTLTLDSLGKTCFQCKILEPITNRIACHVRRFSL